MCYDCIGSPPCYGRMNTNVVKICCNRYKMSTSSCAAPLCMIAM
jgi:hypothetical protein